MCVIVYAWIVWCDLVSCDFACAQFQKTHPDEKTDPKMTMQWLSYSAFHLGDYTKALDVRVGQTRARYTFSTAPNFALIPACVMMCLLCSWQVYKSLLALPDPDPTFHLYAACCLYHLGLYSEAEAEALRGRCIRHLVCL
jgi:hypothetical protein